MTTLTDRFDVALRYAHEAHASQTRKGTGAPYLGHLMGVASIVLDDGGSEDEAIAALLHDAARGSGRPRRASTTFGSASATPSPASSKTAPIRGRRRSRPGPNARWRTSNTPARCRRRASVCPPPTRSTTATRSCGTSGTSARPCGNGSTRAPDDVIAYYQGLVRAYREAGGGRLVDELERIVRGIEREMGTESLIPNPYP